MYITRTNALLFRNTLIGVTAYEISFATVQNNNK